MPERVIQVDPCSKPTARQCHILLHPAPYSRSISGCVLAWLRISQYSQCVQSGCHKGAHKWLRSICKYSLRIPLVAQCVAHTHLIIPAIPCCGETWVTGICNLVPSVSLCHHHQDWTDGRDGMDLRVGWGLVIEHLKEAIAKEKSQSYGNFFVRGLCANCIVNKKENLWILA